MGKKLTGQQRESIGDRQLEQVGTTGVDLEDAVPIESMRRLHQQTTSSGSDAPEETGCDDFDAERHEQVISRISVAARSCV